MEGKKREREEGGRKESEIKKEKAAGPSVLKLSKAPLTMTSHS